MRVRLCKVIAYVSKRILANPRMRILTTNFKMLDFYRRPAPGIVGFAFLSDIVSSSSATSLGHCMYRAAHCHILVIPRPLPFGRANLRACIFHTGSYGSWLPGLCTGKRGLKPVQCEILYHIGQFAKSQNSLQNKGRPHLITPSFSTRS